MQRISDTGMGIEGEKSVFECGGVGGREVGEGGRIDKKENVMKGLGRIKEDGHIAEGYVCISPGPHAGGSRTYFPATRAAEA